MRNHDELPIQISFRLVFIAVAALAAVATTAARADDDVDVETFEYVDVIETVEGSILKGVVTEQTPNGVYKLATADGSLHVIRAASVVKITKQRNPKYRTRTREIAATVDDSIETVDAPARVSQRSKSGVRLEPALAIAFPTGDLVNLGGSPLSYRTSFAPTMAVGYERMFDNNVGLTFGGLARVTMWRLPEEIASVGTHYTVETHAYARAALHLGRPVLHAGLSLGVDTNRTYVNESGMSSTAMGFGMNVQAGIDIAASPATLLQLGLDYHPGTDVIESGWDASVSYFALRLGATVRL